MSSLLVYLGLLVYLEPESTCIFTRFLTIIVLKLKKFEEIFRENAYSENILPRCEWYEMNQVTDQQFCSVDIIMHFRINQCGCGSKQLLNYVLTTYYQRLSLCRGFNLIYWPGHILPRSDRYLILITRLQFFISIKAKNKLQQVYEIAKQK